MELIRNTNGCSSQVPHTESFQILLRNFIVFVHVQGLEEGIYILSLWIIIRIEHSVGIAQHRSNLSYQFMYLDWIDRTSISAVIVEQIRSNLFGSIHIREPGVDQMSLTILFDLENRSNKSLYHRFVVNETFVHPGIPHGLLLCAETRLVCARPCVIQTTHLKYYVENEAGYYNN